MQRYIAFLRSINVGGHTVKMDRLRALFDQLGLIDVSTFIASGNVIFSAAQPVAELESIIPAHLERSLGYPVPTFIRTPGELTLVVRHPPFSEAEVRASASLYVSFLPALAEPRTAVAVAELSTASQILRVHGRELYWLCHTRISASDVDDRALASALDVPTTMRNMNTIRRTLAKLA